jgi:integrase
MRKMINWGITEGLLTRKGNPAEGMESNLPKKKKKDTLLSLEDARIAYRAAGSLGYPFDPIYQLILMTGCRPGEWGECRAPYVDLKQSLLVIPADAYKAGHVHVVPLVPEAVRFWKAFSPTIQARAVTMYSVAPMDESRCSAGLRLRLAF